VDHRWIIRTNGELSSAKEYIHETLIESGRIGRSDAEATRVAPFRSALRGYALSARFRDTETPRDASAGKVEF